MVSNGDAHRPLLTVRETAARLNISEKSVRRLVDRGHIPAFKILAVIRIDADALEDWLHGPEVEVRLRKAILAAFDRGDDDEVKRLQAQYRESAVLTR